MSWSDGPTTPVSSRTLGGHVVPNYRVQIDGQNFLIDMDGAVDKYGFITWRVVQAAEPHAAEKAAVEMLRNDQSLHRLTLNDPGDPPVMDVLEIEEL